MQDSLVSQLVNSVWDDVSQAVSDGLTHGNDQALTDVITVVTEKLTVSKWRPSPEGSAGGGFRRVRRSTTGMAFDYVYRFPLSYDELRSPDTGSIKAWAASARSYELHHVLGHLAAAARRYDHTSDNLFSATAGGWGQLRCLAFKDPPGAIPMPDREPKADWDRPVRVDIDTPLPPIQALIFRLGGGPFVRRPADLALGWIPGTGMGADLVLTEQLQLVKATKETITSLKLASELSTRPI